MKRSTIKAAIVALDAVYAEAKEVADPKGSVAYLAKDLQTDDVMTALFCLMAELDYVPTVERIADDPCVGDCIDITSMPFMIAFGIDGEHARAITVRVMARADGGEYVGIKIYGQPQRRWLPLTNWAKFIREAEAVDIIGPAQQLTELIPQDDEEKAKSNG
jgi:hypothetical protein